MEASTLRIDPVLPFYSHASLVILLYLACSSVTNDLSSSRMDAMPSLRMIAWGHTRMEGSKKHKISQRNHQHDGMCTPQYGVPRWTGPHR